MYLSDRDIDWAIKTGNLIVDPPPTSIDATSIDLHLDRVTEAKIWDIEKYKQTQDMVGNDRPELRIAKYDLKRFSQQYLTAPPDFDPDPTQTVGVRGRQVIVKHGGFVLWQTKEKVGTPPENADLICFIEGKSTRARTGILVHLTAPTIHASWSGNVTLEIANLGPFDLVLEEGDSIAQIIIAKITSPPQKSTKGASVTYGQVDVGGHQS